MSILQYDAVCYANGAQSLAYPYCKSLSHEEIKRRGLFQALRGWRFGTCDLPIPGNIIKENIYGSANLDYEDYDWMALNPPKEGELGLASVWGGKLKEGALGRIKVFAEQDQETEAQLKVVHQKQQEQLEVERRKKTGEFEVWEKEFEGWKVKWQAAQATYCRAIADIAGVKQELALDRLLMVATISKCRSEVIDFEEFTKEFIGPVPKKPEEFKEEKPTPIPDEVLSDPHSFANMIRSQRVQSNR